MGVTFLALCATLTLQGSDITVPVRQGMRLDLRNPYGEIRVSTWSRNEVRVASEQSGKVAFDVQENGPVLRVRPVRRTSDRDRRRDRVEALDRNELYLQVLVTVPAYLDLALRGVETDIHVNGAGADITAETVEGTIEITGGNGFVSLQNQEKPIRVSNARGRVSVAAGDGDVFVRDLVGELSVEAVDGNVDMRGIQASVCQAATVDGNVTYQGTIRDRGRYAFSTHDGNVTLLVPSGANATVSVVNYDGVFETAFPVVLRESRSKRFQFILGTGGAQVELAAFNGDIYLRRADPR